MDLLGLATFGIGRAAIAGTKGAVAGVKAASRSSVFRREMAKAAERGVKQGSKAWKKAQDKAWKAARREVDDAPRGRAARDAVDGSPKGHFPGWKRVGDAFNPKSIWTDSVDSVKGLRDVTPGNIRQALSEIPGVRPSLLDPDVAKSVDDLGGLASISDDAVTAARAGFDAQTNLWAGSTGLASALDGADKAGLFELTGVKEATTSGIG